VPAEPEAPVLSTKDKERLEMQKKVYAIIQENRQAAQVFKPLLSEYDELSNRAQQMKELQNTEKQLMSKYSLLVNKEESAFKSGEESDQHSDEDSDIVFE